MLFHTEFWSISKTYAEENTKETSKSRGGGRGGRVTASNTSHREAPPIELPCEGLQMWRTAVERATSASQLAVCMSQLERSITWEKSSSVVVSIGGKIVNSPVN